MSSQQANPENKQCSTTPCTTCRSHQVQCNGIHPSCGPCKNGNKTCVWPEDGRGPRRGSFTAAARFSILNLDKAPTRSSPRRSQPPKAPVASGRRRHGSGRLSKPVGNDGPQQPQQAQGGKQSRQSPTVPTHARVVSYKKLLEGDEETGAELLAACTNHGCFWLDLESEVKILKGAEWLLHVSQSLHDVPQVEKWKYEEESPEGYNNIRYASHDQISTTSLNPNTPSKQIQLHHPPLPVTVRRNRLSPLGKLVARSNPLHPLCNPQLNVLQPQRQLRLAHPLTKRPRQQAPNHHHSNPLHRPHCPQRPHSSRALIGF